jgi:hypothetical protein
VNWARKCGPDNRCIVAGREPPDIFLGDGNRMGRSRGLTPELVPLRLVGPRRPVLMGTIKTIARWLAEATARG